MDAYTLQNIVVFWACEMITITITKQSNATTHMGAHQLPLDVLTPFSNSFDFLFNDGFCRKALPPMEGLQRKYHLLIQRVEGGQRFHRCHPGLRR